MEHFHIQDLSFSYPGAERENLSHVDLSIEKGEYVLLCGKSGSGKTTLLRHLKQVLAPYGKRTGTILFDGTPLEQVSLNEQAARIGFVMQDPEDQIVTDKVWHELAFGLENLGCDQKTMRLRVAEMASYFGIQGWFHREISELSGGQKQLLNLASIMAMHPEVLILDEPTSQLDPIAAADFLNTIKKINQELGTTILITEHRTEDVFQAADKVIVMENGRVSACGTPRQVGRKLYEENSEMFYALPAPVRVFYGTGETGECPLTVREGRGWLTEKYSAHPPRIRELPPEVPFAHTNPPALEIKEGWFRYEKDGADILKGVSFAVPQGSLFAIVGGNGTGKSTTLKAICGVCRLYRGSVSLYGKKLNQHRRDELFRGVLSMLPQDPGSLFVMQTVGEDLAEMCSDKEKIRQIADLCEVDHLMKQHPSDLSGGELQRAALAKVLLTNPRLLLLDEPTKGLDSFFKKKLAGVLRKLRQQGMTIVMVSHDVEFCAEHADLVSMFFDGQLLTTDTPRRFFGANSFYTTAADRMSRCVFCSAVTADDVIWLIRENGEG